MNPSINYLKALGIMLMVLGHCGCPWGYLIKFLYMFHMPLFFFVSGYCLKPQYLHQPATFLLKKTKGVYWPYVKWSLLFLALHNVLRHVHLYSETNTSYFHLHDFKAQIISIITQMQGHGLMLGGYWFLNALFFGSIIAYCTLKVCKRVEISAILVLAVCLVLNHFQLLIPVIKIGPQAFVAAFLFLVGYYFASKKVPVFPIWAIALSLAATFGGIFFFKCEIASKFYEPMKLLPYLVLSVLATWSFYSLFTLIKNEKSKTAIVLSFISKNTLTILTWHFLMFKLVSALIVWIYDLPIDRLGEFPVIYDYARQGWWVLYLLTAMILTCVIGYFNKFIKSSWLKL